MTTLRPGDPFPPLSLHRPDGDLSLPAALGGGYGVVLLVRGAWCPYCRGQLRAFQRSQADLTAEDIRVAALRVDDQRTTEEVVSRLRLEYPLGYGADAESVSAATRAFVDPKGYLQSTGFVLDPDGRVIVSVYSSGAIGRLVPEDVIGLVRHDRAAAAAPTA